MKSYTEKLLLVLGILLFFIKGLEAQTKLTGIVSDLQNGEPLAGAMIQVKETTQGILSNQKGKFGLEVSEYGVLLVSIPGYLQQEIPIQNRTFINIQLEREALPREEFTSVYRVRGKQALMGANEWVIPEEHSLGFSTSVLSQLNSYFPGIMGMNSGEPGSGIGLRLHGPGSFIDNDPLIMVDGTPIKDPFLNFLPIGDIEHIEIMKNASSSALFGMQGANGAILIKTKKGREGALKIRYSGTAGTQQPVGRSEQIIAPAKYSEAIWRSNDRNNRSLPAWNPYSIQRGEIPSYYYDWAQNGFPGNAEPNLETYSYPEKLIFPSNAEGTDWWDEIFRTGMMTDHYLSLSGGNRTANFFLSGNYNKEEGSMLHTSFERLALRMNSSWKAGRLTIGENMSLSQIRRVRPPSAYEPFSNPVSHAFRMHSMVPVYDISGQNFAGNKSPGLGTARNPVAQLYRNKDNKSVDFQALGDVFAEVKINRHIRAKSRLGVNMKYNFMPFFRYADWEEYEPWISTSFSESWQRNFDWVWANTLSYQNQLSKNHLLHVVLGYEAQRNSSRLFSGSMSNYISQHASSWYLQPTLADPSSVDASSSGDLLAHTSGFVIVDYEAQNKYLFTGSIRRESSSRFPIHRSGIFPSYQLGWRISEEKFVKKIRWIDEMLLHYSWGIAGNDVRLGTPAYDQFGGSPERSYYDIRGNGGLATGYARWMRGNPEMKWEESEATEVGMIASLFKRKLHVRLGLYEKLNRDLLVSPKVSGGGPSIRTSLINTGIIENKGLDLTIAYHQKLKNGLEFSSSLIFGKFKNKILFIEEEVKSFPSESGALPLGNTSMNFPGQAMGSFYGYRTQGLFTSSQDVAAHASQEGAKIGRIRFADLNEDGKINEQDKEVLGSPWPDYTLAFDAQVRFKNWDLSCNLFSSVGAEIFNYNKLFSVFGYMDANYDREILTQSWQSESSNSGAFPALDIEDSYSRQASDFYVESGSYMRLRKMELGYRFPFLKNDQTLRIFIQGYNLWTRTKYSGPDPAIPNVQQSLSGDSFSGYDFGHYPQSKMLLIGLNYQL